MEAAREIVSRRDQEAANTILDHVGF